MRRIGVAAAVFSAIAMGADRLLIVHKLADSAGIYDAATGRMEAEIRTGSKPHEAALSADGRFAYVTNYGADTYTETQPGANTLTIIDLQQRKPAGEIDLGRYRRPHGIERGRSGLFYVTTDFPAALLIVDGPARKVVSAIEITGKLPHMVEVTRDEKWAWTTDSGSGTVTLIDLAARKQVRQIEAGGVPMGFAMTPDEKTLFVATRTNDLVLMIDTSGVRPTHRVRIPGQPVRLALAPDGRTLYVTLIASGEVAEVDTRVPAVVRRARAGDRCEGVTITPDGRFLYVSAQAENKVFKFAFPGLEIVQTIQTAAKPDPILLLGAGAK